MTLEEEITHLQQLLIEDRFYSEESRKEHKQVLGWLLELVGLREQQNHTVADYVDQILQEKMAMGLSEIDYQRLSELESQLV